MSEQQVEKALGTGATPPVDGDMAKGRVPEDVSPEATIPGVTVPEDQPDTLGANPAPANTPAGATTAPATPIRKASTDNG